MIPITFLYKSRSVTGYFSKVSGAGNNALYHLTINGKHVGQLWYVEAHPGFNGLHSVSSGWRFASNIEPGLSELADEFGAVVEKWDK